MTEYSIPNDDSPGKLKRMQPITKGACELATGGGCVTSAQNSKLHNTWVLMCAVTSNSLNLNFPNSLITTNKNELKIC